MDWATIAAVLAAAVAAVAASISFWQARAAFTQADAAKAQATSAREQAQQARRQADLAEKAITLAKDQLMLAREELDEIRTERRERRQAEQIASLDAFLAASRALLARVDDVYGKSDNQREAWNRTPEERAAAQSGVRQAEAALLQAELAFSTAFIKLRAIPSPAVGRAHYVRVLASDLLKRAWAVGPTGDLGARIVGELRALASDAASDSASSRAD